MKTRNLTEGNIYKELISLALPIMATSFIQMSYNLMDLFWLGRLSIESVAAAGTVGFFGWLSYAICMMLSVGVQISVADCIGKKDMESVQKYISNAIKFALIVGIIFISLMILFKVQIIHFFNLDESVTKLAFEYYGFFVASIFFNFVNPVLTGILNGQGESKIPFIINTIALGINIVLDPILIFGFGFVKPMGIKGAALATFIAQMSACIMFMIARFEYFKYLKEKMHLNYVKRLFDLGFPIALQECLFATFSIIMAAIIAHWGKEAIAAQKIGNQIESITWLTVGGFSVALSTFIAQNNGAKKYSRVMDGYKKGMKICIGIGICTTIILFTFAPQLFKLFIPDDPNTFNIGVVYLRILSISEILMCVEIATTGFLNGISLTKYPSINGIIFNFIRIPLSLLVMYSNLRIEWIWVIISSLVICKGISLFIIFYTRVYKNKLKYLLD